MELRVSTFWLPKSGNSLEEYEDAFYPQECFEEVLLPLPARFAIADGASESSFSLVWAALLCEAYVSNTKAIGGFLTGSLRKSQAEWHQQVCDKPLPWYAEQKLQKGAFAAIAGLRFLPNKRDDKRAYWCGHAIGDSCILHIRGYRLLFSMPLNDPDDFDNSPYLLSSNGNEYAEMKAHFIVHRGSCKRGDTFYLMTDALAAWFLSICRKDGEGEVIRLLESICDQQAFEHFINQEREKRNNTHQDTIRLRNDDVTWTRVQLV